MPRGYLPQLLPAFALVYALGSGVVRQRSVEATAR